MGKIRLNSKGQLVKFETDIYLTSKDCGYYTILDTNIYSSRYGFFNKKIKIRKMYCHDDPDTCNETTANTRQPYYCELILYVYTYDSTGKLLNYEYSYWIALSLNREINIRYCGSTLYIDNQVVSTTTDFKNAMKYLFIK